VEVFGKIESNLEALHLLLRVLFKSRNIFFVLLVIFIISFLVYYIFIDTENDDKKSKSSLPDYGEAYSDHGF